MGGGGGALEAGRGGRAQVGSPTRASSTVLMRRLSHLRKAQLAILQGSVGMRETPRTGRDLVEGIRSCPRTLRQHV